MRRALATVGVLIALSGAAVGCGGDDDGGGSGAGAGNGGGETSASEFCDQLRELAETYSGGSFDSPDSIEDTQKALKDALDEVEALDIPSEIEDDFDKVIAAMRAIVDSDLTDAGALAKLDDTDTFKDFPEANQRVTKYMQDECGIDADAGDSMDTGDASEGNG